MHFWLYLCSISCLTGFSAAAGNVILIAKNVTLPFDHIEATFAPSIRGSGLSGMVSVAEPLDACSPLSNEIVSSMNGSIYPFVLMIRGGCTFEHKVRRAQAAGFQAAIVYDNGTNDLVAMAGNPLNININALFVTKVCGETLANYAGAAGMHLRILPGYENPPCSIIALSLVSFMGISAVLATWCFVRRQWFRSERPGVREFNGISSSLVKAMPSLIFTAVLEDNCTSQTCAICLEDYCVGEKLRVLPCCHKFHATCVDTWLTSWRTFCPICKHDAKTKTTQPPQSQSTPILSPTASSISSPSSSSSSPPSLQPSPPLEIVSSVTHPRPFSTAMYDHHPRLNRSPVIHPDSGYTSLSLLNSRYILPCASSPKSSG